MINEIRCDFEDDLCLFFVEDETIDTDTAVFVDMLRDALTDYPVKGFVMDFQAASYLSSTTIGFLFLLLKEFHTDASPFVLTGVSSNLETTINLVGMGKLCEMHPTLEEGMAYLRAR